MDMVKMGSFLAKLRKEHKLTQAELGEKLGVTNKTVSRWETDIRIRQVKRTIHLACFFTTFQCGRPLGTIKKSENSVPK